MNFRRLRLPALVVATLGFGASLSIPAMAQFQTLGAPAAAQGAVEAATDAAAKPAKAKPRKAAAKKKPKGEAIPRNGALVITNRRSAGLVELSATPEKGGDPIVLAHDLAAGAKSNTKLPAKSGCVFSLSGTFDDESTLEAANLNLCKDGRVNLVE